MSVPLRGLPASLVPTLATVLLTFSGCGRSVDEIQPADPRSWDTLADPQFSDDDWPSWRGPERDGRLAARFESLSQQPLWTRPLPHAGHASPCVVGDQIFLATADASSETQFLEAYQLADGEPLWQTELHQGGFMHVHHKNSQASASPISDGQRVFVVNMVHDGIWLTAVDLQGKRLWQTKAGPFRSLHGYGSSPVLHGSLIIVAGDGAGGGFVAALQRETGKLVWRVQRPAGASFGSPVVARTGGRVRLLLSGHRQVTSYDPETGAKQWEVAGPAQTTANTINWSDELVFASGGYPERAVMAFQARDGTLLWKESVKVYVPSMLLLGERLLAIADNGVAYCFEAQTGKILWKQRLPGEYSASPVLVGDHVYLPGEDGQLQIFRAGDEFEPLGSRQLGAGCLASPVVAGRRMLLRTRDALLCFEGQSP